MTPGQPIHLAGAQIQIHPASLLADASEGVKATVTRLLIASPPSHQFQQHHNPHHLTHSQRFSSLTSPSISTSASASASTSALQASANHPITVAHLTSRPRSSSRFQNQHSEVHLEKATWSSVSSSSGCVSTSRAVKSSPITSRQPSIRLLHRKSEIPLPAQSAQALTSNNSHRQLSHLRVKHSLNNININNKNKNINVTPNTNNIPSATTRSSTQTSNFQSSRKQQLVLTSNSKTPATARPILTATNSRLRQGALYARRHQHYPSTSNLPLGGSSNISTSSCSHLTSNTDPRHQQQRLRFSRQSSTTTGSYLRDNSQVRQDLTSNKSKNLSGRFSSLNSSTSSLSVAVVKRARSQAAQSSILLNHFKSSPPGSKNSRSMLAASSHLNLPPNCGAGHSIGLTSHIRSSSTINHQNTYLSTSNLNSTSTGELHYPLVRRSTIVAPHSDNIGNSSCTNNNTDSASYTAATSSVHSDNSENSNAPDENQKPCSEIQSATRKNTSDTQTSHPLHLNQVDKLSTAHNKIQRLTTTTSCNTTNVSSNISRNPLGNLPTTSCLDQAAIVKIDIIHNKTHLDSNPINSAISQSSLTHRERRLSDSTSNQMILGSPLVTPPPESESPFSDELDEEDDEEDEDGAVENEAKITQSKLTIDKIHSTTKLNSKSTTEGDCDNAIFDKVVNTATIPDIPIRTDQISDFYDLEARPFARGKFAQVKRCIKKSSNQCFAAKCIKKRSRLTDIRRDILLEIEALKLSYYSRHIVKLFEVYETSNEMILVLEMASGGELQRIIDDEEVISERLVKRMVKQILEGLIHLHDNNIAHLDIKPQNLLLTKTYPDGDIKLCDFGISRRITKDCEIREICGTPDYVAPEILRYDPISLATDMWSLGVLTYVLLSGYSPFGSENKQQTFCNITQAPLDFPSEIFDKISKEAIDFMKKIIVREPSKRLTSRQAINHIWLR